MMINVEHLINTSRRSHICTPIILLVWLLFPLKIELHFKHLLPVCNLSDGVSSPTFIVRRFFVRFHAERCHDMKTNGQWTTGRGCGSNMWARSWPQLINIHPPPPLRFHQHLYIVGYLQPTFIADSTDFRTCWALELRKKREIVYYSGFHELLKALCTLLMNDGSDTCWLQRPHIPDWNWAQICWCHCKLTLVNIHLIGEDGVRRVAVEMLCSVVGLGD